MKTPALALAFGAVLVAFTFAAPPDAPTPKPAAPAQPKFVFQAYDGDYKTEVGKAKMAFQVNRLEGRVPTEFLHLGETIGGTTYKLHKFEHKSRFDLKYKEEEDISELTLINTATQETLVLQVAKIKRAR